MGDANEALDGFLEPFRAAIHLEYHGCGLGRMEGSLAPMTRKTVTREELYEQVWTTPLLRLALQYGVSNVALGKTCKRLNIPTPGRGYWARIAAGEKLKRPPLPKASARQEWVRLEQDPTVEPVETKAQAPDVAVPATLTAAHPAIRMLAGLLAKAPLDEHQRLAVRGGCLAVTVDTHKRALLLLDGLCKALESRSHLVELVATDQKEFKLVASANGEVIPFSLSERLERTEHKQTAAEHERAATGERSAIRKYDYWPGGRLRIDILESRLARAMWSDLDTRPLDRVLGQVIIGIEAAAEDRRRLKQEAEQRRLEQLQRQAEEDVRRQRQAEAQAREREKQKLAEYKRLLARDVDRVAARWAQAKLVRDFVEAYDAALPVVARTDMAVRWLEAVRRYATKLDPLNEVAEIALEIEPQGEALDAALADMRDLEARVKKEQQ
ncbi:MAG TPA: cell envelope integrity protein TolA [Polyangiaceae bacterium]|nr:cell envelope integrity protein TolA [Polyangiaceae bacterium]